MSIQNNNSFVLLRRKQVEALTTLSRSTIYAKLNPNSPMYDPTFPAPISLGLKSVGWVESEIEAWITSRITASRKKVAI